MQQHGFFSSTHGLRSSYLYLHVSKPPLICLLIYCGNVNVEFQIELFWRLNSWSLLNVIRILPIISPSVSVGFFQESETGF